MTLWCRPVERLELGSVKRGGQDDDEIDIADAGVKITSDQRAVDIEADELVAQDGTQSVGQLRQY